MVASITQKTDARLVFNTLAAMRLHTDHDLKQGSPAILLGNDAIGDRPPTTYYWDTSSTATDNIGTVIKLTGTATGRFLRDGSRSDITQFGATGGSDDTTEIQAAIDATDYLFIPKGTWIASSISWAATTTKVIYGEGAGISIIKHKAAATADMLKAAGRVTSLTIKDLTLDGNRANVTDKTLYTARFTPDNLLVENVTFTGTNRGGIRIEDLQYKAEVRSCQFLDGANHDGTTDTTCLHVTNNAYTDSICHIHHNRFIGQTPSAEAEQPAGIVVNNGDSYNQTCWITDNYFRYLGVDKSGNTSSPIHCYKNGDKSYLARNILRDSCNTVIRWQKSDDFYVVDNIIDGEDSNYSTNINSALQFSGRSPVTENSKATVRGNIVKNMTTALFGIDFEFDDFTPTSGVFTDIDVSCNRIENGNSGIRLKNVIGNLNVLYNEIRSMTSINQPPLLFEPILGLSYPAHINIIGNSFRNCIDEAIRLNDATPTNAYVTLRDNLFHEVAIQAPSNAAVTIKSVKTLETSNNVAVAQIDSGTHDGTNGAAFLTDSTKAWEVDSFIGYTVHNTTDGSKGTITDNDATTITATLSGGSDNTWETATPDAYIITENSTDAGTTTLYNIDSPEVLTPVSGVVTVGSWTGTRSFAIDTEGTPPASTDDVDTISGGQDGQVVIFMPENSGRDVTFKHNTDNIRTLAGTDTTLNFTDEFIMLLNRSGNWYELIYAPH